MAEGQIAITLEHCVYVGAVGRGCGKGLGCVSRREIKAIRVPSGDQAGSAAPVRIRMACPPNAGIIQTSVALV